CKIGRTERPVRTPSVVVIAGTDTGVGKTWVGCAMARALRRIGRQVLAVKPLETGCPGAPTETEDGVALARATGQTQPAQALLRLREPVAPSEAADREGQQIDFDHLVRCVRRYRARADVTLVEGAGGLLSPLTWDRNAVDLALALEARVLLVSADRLGTISHTLMAVKWLELSGLEIAGVVLSAPARPDASTGSNAAAISRVSGFSRVLAIPRAQPLEVTDHYVQGAVSWLDLE
ncbi:dethiobiotin synthase, partial [Myxococcota bacterium]